MPINRALYPKTWPEISKRIRERAGNKCELCGAKNYQRHPRTGKWVVLTVAHWPDPSPANCDDHNLLCLCQLCHNRLDGPMRGKHAHLTKLRKKRERARAGGQLEILEVLA